MHASRQNRLEGLKTYISAGKYEPGDRLPAGREPMGAFGMTCNTPRRAMEALEQEGVIWRHVGKGTYLSSERNEKELIGLMG